MIPLGLGDFNFDLVKHNHEEKATFPLSGYQHS